MTEKDVKKLSRTDLLKLLIQQTEENERLAARNAALEQELSRRTVIMEKSGSIAEASLQLSAVFTQTQDAADRYLESIREKESRVQTALDETAAQCAKMEADTRERCRQLEVKTRQVCTKVLEQLKQRTVQQPSTSTKPAPQPQVAPRPAPKQAASDDMPTLTFADDPAATYAARYRRD